MNLTVNLQAVTVLVAMVSRKNFGEKNCRESRQFGDLCSVITCQAIPKKFPRFCETRFYSS